MGISRHATAHWSGDLKSGNGTISTPQSDLMRNTAYGFNTRFGDKKGVSDLRGVVGNLVQDLGFKSIHELDYWQSFQIGDVKITLTPCHHWGARMLHDSQRGFGGYVIEVGGRSIFHCGDTAYFEGFKEIGERLPIDIALLPIGAYDPPSGREVHMNPEEAVQAFLDLKAKTLVPMHYGTFRLSYEPPQEPPERLLVCARQHGIEKCVCIMNEGAPVVL